jgi:hypothetical protein
VGRHAVTFQPGTNDQGLAREHGEDGDHLGRSLMMPMPAWKSDQIMGEAKAHG